jgi:hypothetical protein
MNERNGSFNVSVTVVWNHRAAVCDRIVGRTVRRAHISRASRLRVELGRPWDSKPSPVRKPAASTSGKARTQS